MHFHLPKPLHGWREFAGEVGIIVIGVLIALGAEQAIEAIHQRSEVEQTRAALDAELAHNLAAFDYRLSLEPCARSRLNELQSIVDRQGHAIAPLGHDLQSPLTVNLEFAVWDAATGEARSLIPLQAKLQYAKLYGTFRHYESLRNRESEAWVQLTDLDLHGPLSAEDAKQAKLTIKRLRRLDELLPAYASFIERSAAPLGIRPEADINAPAEDLMRKDRTAVCSPLF
jgi:hypothetical protein